MRQNHLLLIYRNIQKISQLFCTFRFTKTTAIGHKHDWMFAIAMTIVKRLKRFASKWENLFAAEKNTVNVKDEGGDATGWMRDCGALQMSTWSELWGLRERSEQSPRG